MTSCCYRYQLHLLSVFLTGLLLIAVVVVSAQPYQQQQQQQPFIWPASSILEHYYHSHPPTPSARRDSTTTKTPPSVLYTLTVGNNCHNKNHYFNVSCTGYCSDHKVQQLLDAAVGRFRQTLITALVPTVPKNSPPPPINPHNATLHPITTLHVHLTTNDTTLHPAVNESYVLHIPDVIANNNNLNNNDHDDNSSPSLSTTTTTAISIELSAPTIYGAMHGLQTLWQLFQFAWLTLDNGVDGCRHCRHCHHHAPVFILASPTIQPPITILDGPVYSYRGILVDTARHYLPLSLLEQQLQAMEYNKFNTLHWHLTDSQSFPYASKLYPELAVQAAYCATCVYTADDIAFIVEQAAQRGIRVIVEVDLPGHSRAIGKSHPELMTLCSNDNNNHDKKTPSEPLNATSDTVYDFVRNLYHELATIFPDPWMHVGGDEVPLHCWENNTQIQMWMKEHGVGNRPVDLLAYFETKLLEIVMQMNDDNNNNNRKHKRPIVWQELFDLGLPLSNQTIIDIWMLSNLTTIQHATKLGFDVILSACWYLDHLDTDWWGFYQCNPRDFLNDTTSSNSDTQKQRIIGGHASMWGERVDETNFMSRVWPRASAVGEKLWTGVSEKAKETSQERLHRFRCRMVKLGVPAQPIIPGYCGDDDQVVSTRLGTRSSSWWAFD